MVFFFGPRLGRMSTAKYIKTKAPQAPLHSIHFTVLCLKWLSILNKQQKKPFLFWLFENILHFSGFVLV